MLGRPLSDPEARQFTKYLELLIKWGEITRLISSTEPGWIVEHLLLDSLLFLRLLSPEVRSLLDFGAGAGLPGIPIKIVRPEIELTLLEGRRRRASCLSAAVRELGLHGAHVVNTRAEDAHELRRSFDAVAMRCAGALERTLPLAAEFVAPGGTLIASGPPEQRPLTGAEWITVPGLRPGSRRRFAVTVVS